PVMAGKRPTSACRSPAQPRPLAVPLFGIAGASLSFFGETDMNALAYAENSTEELGTLVVAAREGDRAAFGELCGRYGGMVYSIALARLGSHAEAQELCQEVFMHALEQSDQLP